MEQTNYSGITRLGCE